MGRFKLKYTFKQRFKPLIRFEARLSEGENQCMQKAIKLCLTKIEKWKCIHKYILKIFIN